MQEKRALIGYTPTEGRVYADDRNYFLWHWPHSGRTGLEVVLERLDLEGLPRRSIAYTFLSAARAADRLAGLPPLPRDGIAVVLPAKISEGLAQALADLGYHQIVRTRKKGVP